MYKGKIVLNGAQIEVETDSPNDLASVLTSILSNNIEKTEKKEITPRETVLEKPVVTPAGRSIRKDNGKKRMNYYAWSDKDVLTIAGMALKHGDNREGFPKKVIDRMERVGDVKTRSYENFSIFANRLHRYLYTGDKSGVNKNILAVLMANGFSYIPSRLRVNPQEA